MANIKKWFFFLLSREREEQLQDLHAMRRCLSFDCRSRGLFSVLLPATLSQLVMTLTSALLCYHAKLESHDLFFNPEPMKSSKSFTSGISRPPKKGLVKTFTATSSSYVHFLIISSYVGLKQAENSMSEPRPSIRIQCYTNV